MKINWQVRLKNPVWWAQVAIAVIAPILGYLGITAGDLTTWQTLGEVLLSAVSNPYVIGLVVISVWNTVNDPTTSGFSDSARALSYQLPSPLK